jgi:predicted Zn-dependent peptidase
VNTERDVVLEERRMRVDNDPQALMREQMEAALYLSHPYGRPVIGWPEEIRHIGRIEAQDYYVRHYAPNNAILVVAGDVTPEEVRMPTRKRPTARCRRAACRAPNSPSRPGSAKRADVSRATRREGAAVPAPLSRAELHRSQARRGRGARNALAQLMGGDATSTLYRELVVKRKLASDAGASYDGYTRDAGEFSVYAAASRRAHGCSGAGVDAIIKSYVDRAAQTADLERAKTQLVADATYQRDSQYSLASAYGQALAIGLTVDDVEEWPDRIRAVAAATRQTGCHRRSHQARGRDGLLVPGPAPMIDAARGVRRLAVCALAIRRTRARRADLARAERRAGLVRLRSHAADDRDDGGDSRGVGLRSAGKDGLANFAASLLDEGAGRLNSDAFHTALANRAIRLSVSPDRDYLIVQLVTLTDNAKDAFQSSGHGARQAALRRRCDPARAGADAFGAAAGRRRSVGRGEQGFFRSLFSRSSLRPSVDGTPARRRDRRGRSQGFAATHWVNSGLKIAVSGDVDPATLDAASEAHSAGCPNKAPRRRRWPTHVGQPGVQVVAMDVPQPTVIFGMPGFLRAGPRFHSGLCRQLHRRRRRVFVAADRSGARAARPDLRYFDLARTIIAVRVSCSARWRRSAAACGRRSM